MKFRLIIKVVLCAGCFHFDASFSLAEDDSGNFTGFIKYGRPIELAEPDFERLWFEFQHEYDQVVLGANKFRFKGSNGELFWRVLVYPELFFAAKAMVECESWNKLVEFGKRNLPSFNEKLIDVWRSEDVRRFEILLVPILYLEVNNHNELVSELLASKNKIEAFCYKGGFSEFLEKK